MISEENRRDHHRMAIVSPAKYRPQAESDAAFIACTVKNLSATGMLLIAREAHAVGDQLFVVINPDNPITPPLQADLEVLRTDAAEDGELEIACKIIKMH